MSDDKKELIVFDANSGEEVAPPMQEPIPVGEVVQADSTVDPLLEQAQRIFGPDAVSIWAKCNEVGVDFEGHVLSACAKLNDLEAEVEGKLAEFQKNLPPPLWPCISNALLVNHSIENARRMLMGMLDAGVLGGPAAQAVADMMGNLTANMNQFINATLTELLGGHLAGYDEPTVKEKIIAPFNDVMGSKRATFDMIGEANNAFTQTILKAMAEQAQAAAKAVGEPAAPVVH